ncbi:MAG: hypothetical protein ACYDA1_04850, partial [Vulcanimicrobiaceae bacterium]
AFYSRFRIMHWKPVTVDEETSHWAALFPKIRNGTLSRLITGLRDFSESQTSRIAYAFSMRDMERFCASFTEATDSAAGEDTALATAIAQAIVAPVQLVTPSLAISLVESLIPRFRGSIDSSTIMALL